MSSVKVARGPHIVHGYCLSRSKNTGPIELLSQLTRLKLWFTLFWPRRMAEPLARLLSEHTARSEGEGGASGRRHGNKGRRGAEAEDEEEEEPISML